MKRKTNPQRSLSKLIAEDKYELEMLVSGALLFRRSCLYGPEDEQKTCIWPGGGLDTWTEKSSGRSWIGVKGIDTTCVVTSSVVTHKRPAGKTQLGSSPLLHTALADMIGDTSYSFRRRIPQSSKAGPFAVVSVAPGVPEESSQEASLAINFLQEKLNNRSSLSSKETTQIAVCALKYLLGPKFKSDKIEGILERGDGENEWKTSFRCYQPDNHQGFDNLGFLPLSSPSAYMS